MPVTFPHMGNLGLILADLFQGLGMDVVVPPPITKNTFGYGTALAPAGSCLPFKLVLGNFIEALQSGADTIVMLGGTGPCRFGYFGHLLEMILRDQGYRFQMIVLEPEHLWPGLRTLIGGADRSWPCVLKKVRLAWAKLRALDSLHRTELLARPYLPAVAETRCWETAAAIMGAGSSAEVSLVLSAGQDLLNRACPPAGQGRPRVGLVGDIYTLLEPTANHRIEIELGRLGLELERSIYLSSWLINNVSPLARRRYGRMLRDEAGPYLEDAVGGHGLDTVAWSVRFARRGLAGVLQLLPLTCMPEIVAESILPRVSKDYRLPIVSLAIDEHDSGSGLQLRLEAFVEMLNNPKNYRKSQKNCSQK